MKACDVSSMFKVDNYYNYIYNNEKPELIYLFSVVGDKALIMFSPTSLTIMVNLSDIYPRIKYDLEKIKINIPEIIEGIDDPENLTEIQLINLVDDYTNVKANERRREYEAQLDKFHEKIAKLRITGN